MRAAGALLALMLLGVGGAARAESGGLTAADLATVAALPEAGAAVPLDDPWRNARGEATSLRALLGTPPRPAILLLDYAGCQGLCGLVLDGLAATLRQVPLTPGRDYGVIAASIDPRDGPAEAAAFGAAHLGGDPALGAAIRLLTGDAAAIGRLAAATGFRWRADATVDQLAHPATLTILTPDGRIARSLPALGAAPLDLQLALAEAGAGRTSAAATQALLLCYAFDPAQGRYGLAIGRLLQLTGALTLAGLLLVVLRAARAAERR